MQYTGVAGVVGREETSQGFYIEPPKRLMPQGIHAKLVRVAVCLLVILIPGISHSEQFRTNDPLQAFVNQEYPWGDDYFIHGNRDTYLFRCILTKKIDDIDGIALSEISIWGNHGGPWEIFQKSEQGDYVYIGTEDIANTSCLERCQSKEYLALGQCQWQRGWPKQ